MISKRIEIDKDKEKPVILNIDSLDKIPLFEKAIKNGNLSYVFANADWCHHCVKFKKNIWEPMCKKSAIHNRIAIKADIVPKTSLENAKFKYLPSILVINEKGKPEEFQTPEGEITNAMPTPKTVNDMVRAVNIPLKPMSNEQLNSIESESDLDSESIKNIVEDVIENKVQNKVENILENPQEKKRWKLPFMSGGSLDLQERKGNLYTILNRIIKTKSLEGIFRKTRGKQNLRKKSKKSTTIKRKKL